MSYPMSTNSKRLVRTNIAGPHMMELPIVLLTITVGQDTIREVPNEYSVPRRPLFIVPAVNSEPGVVLAVIRDNLSIEESANELLHQLTPKQSW